MQYDFDVESVYLTLDPADKAFIKDTYDNIYISIENESIDIVDLSPRLKSAITDNGSVSVTIRVTKHQDKTRGLRVITQIEKL
jgi:hypothetical protein